MATNQGKNKPARTFPQMVEDGLEKRQNSKLYKAEAAAFVDEQLSALVRKTTEELASVATSEPVTLTDTETVKQRTILYLRACEASSSIPSVAGLARSMGLSRRALYDTIERRSPPETAKWLELFRDACSDILAEASLRNSCNNITAIFLEKALYGLRESVEVVARPAESPLGEEPDQIALEARIAGIVVDD